MARVPAVHVSALCSVLSFVYISHSLERHSLTERPRLSSLLVSLLSGLICYGISAAAKFIPGADGRFVSAEESILGVASDDALLKGSSAHLPKRPRRWSVPALVFIIVLRLEVFHLVNKQQQCATPGLESFLCILLIAYEIFQTRRRWGFPVSEDDDDPWRSIFDDIYDWFSGPRVVMFNTVVSAFVFSLGTYLSLSNIRRSTYFCFHLIDSRFKTVSLQLFGLVLDAAIIILLWRLLAWARTIKLRLRVLSTVLLLSSASVGLIWVVNTVFRGSRAVRVSVGSLYGFDALVDSFAFASLLISSMFWICETSTITPISILTFLVGIWSACDKIFHYGDWLHLSRLAALGPLWMIVAGAIVFLYLHDLRSVLFIRRILFVSLLLSLLLGTTIFISVKKPQTFRNGIHPANDLVYTAHVEHDRWKALVSVSATLSTAVTVYQERHNGRLPPPNFDAWYKYAADDSVMIDEFQQIDRDVGPFWNVAPSVLRKRADEMAAMPDVATITVKDGKVSRKDTGSADDSKDLDELVSMIAKFSQYLPDMVLPINLQPAPRVLPSWEEANTKSRAAQLSSVADLLTRRSTDDVGSGSGNGSTTAPVEHKKETIAEPSTPSPPPAAAAAPITSPGVSTPGISASDLRRMMVDACSPLSRSRTRPHWNFMEFCWPCAKDHTYGQLLAKWQQSLDTCAQPDLRLLHGFSLTDPPRAPLRHLAPLFGASKTDEFGDIVIPLPRTRLAQPDIKWQFARRYDSLVWRGVVGERAPSSQALRGSHKYRLLHLASAPYARDDVVMVLPTPGDGDIFSYERVPAAEANALVPFSVGVTNSTPCAAHDGCALVQKAYGLRDEAVEPLEYRYVLLMDDDDGPPQHQLLRTLRSNSVPLVSTIFRTWYTERLMPWLHFVPVDPRLQALHTTFAYFSGTVDRPPVNGRDTAMQGRTADAEWIVQQGQKWAAQALRDKDMEIYLFRLLLEWGRLIDDERDSIGFRKDGNGAFQSDAWTRHQSGGER
ncbi:glycosyltransferase family 90 protein [Trichoderma longibrachiatum ATCC 18648]|uniref:Glycosyltransferase family 90 protein n=1 Tax=Trichoderma longibrachiatum ATCC 18648 TaxID=983965 RepID=A0A2T4BXN6_TRILO|nr:glycosyltransferase family 90 protein [Trichoderma longibrachiatum ATCC 18648]